MCDPVGMTQSLANLPPTALALVWDALKFIKLNLRSRQALAAEGLFLLLSGCAPWEPIDHM
jgi:hypothetical protein